MNGLTFRDSNTSVRNGAGEGGASNLEGKLKDSAPLEQILS